MPTKKGTSKAQTPEKAKRIIKIKRKTSTVVTPVKETKKPQVELINKPEVVNGRSNRFFSFVGLDGKKYSLTQQQKKFVEFYLEFKASGVDAIIEAGYDVYFKDKKTGKSTGHINYKLAAVMASENLIKPNVSAYVTSLLEQYGYDDDNATKQHLFLMNQYGDLKSKSKALDMYFKIKGSYAPDQHEHKLDAEITEALTKIASLVP